MSGERVPMKGCRPNEGFHTFSLSVMEGGPKFLPGGRRGQVDEGPQSNCFLGGRLRFTYDVSKCCSKLEQPTFLVCRLHTKALSVVNTLDLIVSTLRT